MWPLRKAVIAPGAGMGGEALPLFHSVTWRSCSWVWRSTAPLWPERSAQATKLWLLGILGGPWPLRPRPAAHCTQPALFVVGEQGSAIAPVGTAQRALRSRWSLNHHAVIVPNTSAYVTPPRSNCQCGLPVEIPALARRVSAFTENLETSALGPGPIRYSM